MKNRILELRTTRRLSMDRLGELVGTTGSTISKLEKGQIQLDTDWLERLGKAFSVHPADIIDDRPKGTARGFVEDVELYTPDKGDPLFQLVTKDRELWTAKTNALSELGIEERSVLLVETAKLELRMGDALIVAFTDESTGATINLLREFIEPRLLTTNSVTENLAPINTGSAKVRVHGRVLHRITPFGR